MKIESLKDLEKLVKLCKKTGIDHIRIGDVELWVNDFTPTPIKDLQEPFVAGEIGPDTKIDMPDELTEEQRMFYSAVPHGQ